LTPLTEAEKVDIRRFCGYPAYYATAASVRLCYMFQTLGTLNARLDNLSREEIVVARGLLSTLRRLELAVPAASETLDTNQAANWTRNQNEVDDRMRLLAAWQRKLCSFLGVAPGRGVMGTTAFVSV
jgi:hypothetical protein